MGRGHPGLVGRRAELAALRAAAKSRSLTVLHGAPGSGKGAVLGRVGAELTERGILVLEISGAAPRPEWDRFGVRIFLDAIRARFEDLGGRARLTEAIDTVGRLCVPASYASAWERSRLVTALVAVFRMLAPVAVIVDDADGVAEPAIGLGAAHLAGCLVFAACADEASLGVVAETTIELAALPVEDADGVLGQAVGMPVDDALRRAVREELGELYGNPGTVVSTVAELRRRDRLQVVHGQVCLREPEKPVALSPGHPLLLALDACGDLGRDLVRLAGSTAFGVDEIPVLAEATHRSAAEYGRAADRLVRAGVLGADVDGRLSIRCPALGTAVGKHGAAALHGAIATYLLDEEGARPQVLVRHLAAAGPAVPRRPAAVRELRDEAPDPASWYAVWWHTEDGGERSRAAVELVRRFVRGADYSRLARFVEEVPAGELDPAGLAAAAALAALHSGRPVSAPVRAAVTRDDRVPAAIGFCDRWFAGADDGSLEEVETAFAPLRSSPVLPTIACRTPGLENALAMRDLVPVLGSVLGADFGTPVDGPLAAYHRVLAGYAGGDWSAALSAARELELDPHADPFARHSARLHAAEMCSWRGENQHAVAWLDSVPADCAFPALRTWAIAGHLLPDQ